MTTTDARNLINETRYLETCLAELAEADRACDEVRRFYAVEELAGIIMHTSARQLKTRAKVALKQSAAKAKRARKGMTDADRMKAATRSLSLPTNCLLLMGSDGEITVQEF